MSQTSTATGPTIHARTSRLWAMCKLRFTELVFPSHLSADRLGITLIKVESWFTPWTRQDEHVPPRRSHPSARARLDSISIESSGGINPLSVDGLPKSAAHAFVTQVRNWMNA